MTQYGVVLFHTTSAAIRAEKLLKKEGFSVRLIPTPRQFSSDCGVALQFHWDRQEPVKSALDGAGAEIDSIHLLKG